MNREEFKMNLIRQFRDEPEQVMPLLIPNNRLMRVNNSIYANKASYYSDEYKLFINLSLEQVSGNDIVQINFIDMTDDEKAQARLAANDLTNKSTPARVYYSESIRFSNQKLKVKLELFYLIFEEGTFRKENSNVESELIFSFIDKKVEGKLTFSKMIQIIEKVSTLRRINTYIDALYTKELENQFFDEVSVETVGDDAYQELLEALRGMDDPSQYDSSACFVLKTIKEMFPEKP